MSVLDPLLVAVWREVSRHLDIGESTETIAALLGKHMPLGALAVRRLDAEHRRVQTVASSPADLDSDQSNDADLSESDCRRLQRWLKQHNLLQKSADDRKATEIANILRLTTNEDDWLLASLAGEHGSQGVLFISTKTGQRFSRQHAAFVAALQEPLGVALDNDARLHELTALQEAAEAERQSLLRRLGRSESGDTIVGGDSGLEQVMQRVDLVSRSEVPVLILGETGTGKELIARAIHNRSERHSGPFLRVNCGAIPRELIDSQLFGHERGAFTGANEAREGWFERADKGTLFLDEIGELPLDAQVRFLRVLQDGFVERVGGTKSLHVDVRVIAATHRDLAGMVQEGGFREDLWYRIAVFPILLPPLRDRVEDIPALARHFAQRAAIRFGLALAMPSDADIELLQGYEWPGNIRELGAVIDRAAILGNGDSLEMAAALGLGSPHRLNSVSSGRGRSELMDSPLRGTKISSLNEAMRVHIESALHATHGRVEGPRGAARLLGINPHTLRARMRKLKIDWAAYRGPIVGE